MVIYSRATKFILDAGESSPTQQDGVVMATVLQLARNHQLHQHEENEGTESQSFVVDVLFADFLRSSIGFYFTRALAQEDNAKHLQQWLKNDKFSNETPEKVCRMLSSYAAFKRWPASLNALASEPELLAYKKKKKTKSSQSLLISLRRKYHALDSHLLQMMLQL